MLKQKIKSIQTELTKQNLSGLFIGNFGFTQADTLLYYLLLAQPEYLLCFIPQKGKPVLYTIPFEAEELKKNYPEFKVRKFDKTIVELLEDNIAEKSRVGIRIGSLPASVYLGINIIKKVKFVDFKNEEKIVAKKQPEEIKILSKACQITDQVFEKTIKNWKKFKTEKESRNFIKIEFAKLGLEESFPTIIASGANAANPHYHTKNQIIQKGFCVIDMGIKYKGYCSDMTRTIYVGTPSQEEIDLYNHLLLIQKQTIEKVKVGTNVGELDTFTRDRMGKKLNKLFIHGLGHGLGSQVHEWPSVSKSQNIILEENMVITIEPGIYQKNKFGIRIEDDVVVSTGRPKILNKATKNLIIKK